MASSCVWGEVFVYVLLAYPNFKRTRALFYQFHGIYFKFIELGKRLEDSFLKNTGSLLAEFCG